jgi:hypothetical protein
LISCICCASAPASKRRSISSSVKGEHAELQFLRANCMCCPRSTLRPARPALTVSSPQSAQESGSVALAILASPVYYSGRHIARHCSVKCRFVGLVNRHAPMRSSPTRLTLPRQRGLHQALHGQPGSPPGLPCRPQRFSRAWEGMLAVRGDDSLAHA